jgi:hypothetical protein
VRHPEIPAGLRVDLGAVAVAGAVVGEHPLVLYPHPLEPGDRPSQEARGGGALLVGQDLDVGEVAADVDELPADRPGSARALDVDVDELARPPSLLRNYS